MHGWNDPPGEPHGWEVFDPRDGFPVFTVRWRAFAWLLARVFRLDYDRPGRGW
jgi:hypothetical protein